MQMGFVLDYIEGTKEIVLGELKEKYPSCRNLEIKNQKIYFTLGKNEIISGLERVILDKSKFNFKNLNNNSSKETVQCNLYQHLNDLLLLIKNAKSQKNPIDSYALQKGVILEVFRERLLSPLGVTDIVSNKRINLSKKNWRSNFSSGGLNPSLAYIMCRLAEIKKGDVVADPFCGSGTLALSSILYFPSGRVLASDVSGKSVDITTKAFRDAAIPKSKYVVFRSNISMLKYKNNYIDCLISNLPFGIRVGKHIDNIDVYENFARKSNAIVKSEGGKIVILTMEKKLIIDSFKNYKNIKLLKKIDIKIGGLTPSIFIFQKN